MALEKTASLDSSDLDELVRELIASKCSSNFPPNCQEVASTSLSEKQVEDLLASIRELLGVYNTGSPSNLVSYMSSRGEKPNPRVVKSLREMLISELSLSSEKVGSKSDSDVLQTYWKAAKINPHWKSVLYESGCVNLYKRSEEFTKEFIDSLGASDQTLFASTITFNHMFIGDRSINDIRLSDGFVYCADVTLVVEYDRTLSGARAPYYLRLWFDTVSQQWRPLQMVTVETESIKPPRMVF